MNMPHIAPILGAMALGGALAHIPQPSTGAKMPPGPVLWTVADLQEQPGPSGVGNVTTFNITSIARIEPASTPDRTLISLAAPYHSTVIVTGQAPKWRARWTSDLGATERVFP